MTRHDHRRVIAIDGPAAAGKSTVAKGVADQLGALLFDTGALYRSVTLLAHRYGVLPSEADRLAVLISRHRIAIRPATIQDGRQVDVLVDDEDVTWAIRKPEIDGDVSEVSAHPRVREALLAVQRNIANGSPVVMVGRDIGTVVIPDAGLKVYLDASPEERAHRRLVELQGRGEHVTYAEVLADLIARDAVDSTRESAPLVAAKDARLVGTDGKTIADVTEEIVKLAHSVWRKLGMSNG